MSEGINAILESVKNVNRMISNYQNTIEEVAAGSSQISDAMISLTGLSNSNEDTIRVLENAVSHFRIREDLD